MAKADATTTQPYPPSKIAEIESSASSDTSLGDRAAVTGRVTNVVVFGAGIGGAVGKVESSICSDVVVADDMSQVFLCDQESI